MNFVIDKNQDGFASDIDVPAVDFSDYDSGVPEPQTPISTIPVKTFRHQRKRRHKKRSSRSSEETVTAESPPSLVYTKSHSDESSSGPSTPDFPPFLQLMGVVADKAKEFFGSNTLLTPGTLENIDVSPVSPLNSNFSNTRFQTTPISSPEKNKIFLNAQIDTSQPPPQYQHNPHFDLLDEKLQYLQQGLSDPESYQERSSANRRSKQSKNRKKVRKVNDLDINSYNFNFLVFLGSSLVYVLAGKRPIVEGPITAFVDKFMANIQLIASIAIIFSSSVIGIKYLNSRPTPRYTKPVSSSSPMESVPVAGTSFSPVQHTYVDPALYYTSPPQKASQLAPQMANIQLPFQQQHDHPQSLHPMQFVSNNYSQLQTPFQPEQQMYQTKELYLSPDKYSEDQFSQFSPPETYSSRRSTVVAMESMASTPAMMRKSDIFSKENPLGFYTGPTPVPIEEKNSYYQRVPSVSPAPTNININDYTTFAMRPEIMELYKRYRNEKSQIEVLDSDYEEEPVFKQKKQKNKKKPVVKAVGQLTKLPKKDYYVDEFSCKPYGPPPIRYRGVQA